MSYYPLAKGNSWTYKMKDGNSYVNEVTGDNAGTFTMKNSLMPQTGEMRKEGDTYLANHWDGKSFQALLKENAKPGENWEVKFTANGLESVLVMTVKETGISKDVEGRNYPDVILVEAESKLAMNGNLMSLNYFTQYYYAKDVGLILTTTSSGDSHALTNFILN